MCTLQINVFVESGADGTYDNLNLTGFEPFGDYDSRCMYECMSTFPDVECYGAYIFGLPTVDAHGCPILPYVTDTI